MRYLLVTQYFWPENFVINDLARELLAQGHEVTVLTGKPNYPSGRVEPGYRAMGWQHEQLFDGVEVFRVPIVPRGGGGALRLFGNYMGFAISAALSLPVQLRGRRFDGVLVFAPSPITAVIPGIVARLVKRAPLALWVQDLWPESLSATGFVSNRLALWLVARMVSVLYAACDVLLLQSPAFESSVRRHAPTARTLEYPNPVPSHYWSKGENAQLPAHVESALAAGPCVLFAGNLGAAQALETLLDAADCLGNGSDVRLLIAGSGSRHAWLQAEVERRRLSNVILLGQLPSASMPALYARCLGLLVTLRDEEIFAYTIPSKVQVYLAAGRPVIASVPGVAARLIDDIGAGFSCAPEDGAALARRIVEIGELPDSAREAMGQAGHAYAREHFEIGQLAERLTSIFKRLRG